MRWKLLKYGRLQQSTPAPGGSGGMQVSTADKWQIIEAQDLWLSVEKTHHLLVMNGTIVLENYSLWNAEQYIQGVLKMDSLLIVLKVAKESRRFRIKFAPYGGRTGEQQCEAAVQVLRNYFSVKTIDIPRPTEGLCHTLILTWWIQRRGWLKEAAVAENPSHTDTEGEVTLSKLAKVISGDLQMKLPLAYQQSAIPADEVDLFLRLCLTDCNFPAFVDQVEAALHKIINEVQQV